MHDPDTNPLTNVAYTKVRFHSQSDVLSGRVYWRKSDKHLTCTLTNPIVIAIFNYTFKSYIFNSVNCGDCAGVS
jgi:hypothetical protein